MTNILWKMPQLILSFSEKPQNGKEMNLCIKSTKFILNNIDSISYLMNGHLFFGNNLISSDKSYHRQVLEFFIPFSEVYSVYLPHFIV